MSSQRRISTLSFQRLSAASATFLTLPHQRPLELRPDYIIPQVEDLPGARAGRSRDLAPEHLPGKGIKAPGTFALERT